jgi:heme exporter protein CcmD
MAFLDMGGYWPYVWPSYAVTLAVMALNVVWARQLLKRSRKEALRRLEIGAHAIGGKEA